MGRVAANSWRTKSAASLALRASTNGLLRRVALTQKPISPETTTQAANVAATVGENRNGTSAAMPNVPHEQTNSARPT
jgi:hypothetical protein